MDDTLRNVTFSLLALFVLHGSLEQRARRGAEQQISQNFNHTGHVEARLTPRGLLGLEAASFWAVDVYGDDISAERLPFTVIPRKGWKGSIRHLRLHLKRFTLAGLPIRSFEADIPSASFDLGHAFYKSEMVLRGVGRGEASVSVDAAGLKTFIMRKFRSTLSEVEIRFMSHRVRIGGQIDLLSALTPMSATGLLMVRDGRYLDLIDPEIRINETIVTPRATVSLLKQINPVLDIDRDLGLGRYFTMQSVEIGEDEITIHGIVTIPVASSPIGSP